MAERVERFPDEIWIGRHRMGVIGPTYFVKLSEIIDDASIEAEAYVPRAQRDQARRERDEIKQERNKLAEHLQRTERQCDQARQEVLEEVREALIGENAVLAWQDRALSVVPETFERILADLATLDPSGEGKLPAPQTDNLPAECDGSGQFEAFMGEQAVRVDCGGCSRCHPSGDQGEGAREIVIDRHRFRVPGRTMAETDLRQLPTPPVGVDRDIYQQSSTNADAVPVFPRQLVDFDNGSLFFTAPRFIHAAKPASPATDTSKEQRGPCLNVGHDQIDCSHLPESERCRNCSPASSKEVGGDGE
jgi:hypothetical protein